MAVVGNKKKCCTCISRVLPSLYSNRSHAAFPVAVGPSDRRTHWLQNHENLLGLWTRVRVAADAHKNILTHTRTQNMLTHTHTHTLTHTHARTHAHTHARTLARSHARTLARSHACTHARTHARTLARSHAHARTSQPGAGRSDLL